MTGVASWQQAFLQVAQLLPAHHRSGSTISLFLTFFLYSQPCREARHTIIGKTCVELILFCITS